MASLSESLLTSAPAVSDSLTPQELARRRRKIPEEEFTEGPEGLKWVQGCWIETGLCNARTGLFPDRACATANFATAKASAWALLQVL